MKQTELHPPAAFGRLCVETLIKQQTNLPIRIQPPSGGCVLKQFAELNTEQWQAQPPSGGCVLKLPQPLPSGERKNQPPSGGCVLKPCLKRFIAFGSIPAAFGRLCVETLNALSLIRCRVPAAFGRLCVETSQRWQVEPTRIPAAFGRLCVETLRRSLCRYGVSSSRLRAAVC